jgi:hypothetical protein
MNLMDDKSVERRIAMLEAAVARVIGIVSAGAALFVTEKVSRKYFPTTGDLWSWQELAWAVVFLIVLYGSQRYFVYGRLTKPKV